MTKKQDITTSSAITRRSALAGSVAVAAAAIPAGMAVVATPGSAFLTQATDPHIGWWLEIKEVRALLDGEAMGEDELLDRERELEDLIALTPPTTPEGAAIVASMIVAGHARVYPKGTAGIEPEDAAGGTLARWFLASLPPAVLQRAGLEGVA